MLILHITLLLSTSPILCFSRLQINNQLIKHNIATILISIPHKLTITINYIFWLQLSQCEIASIRQLQKYVHFKYILWHFEYIWYFNNKNLIIVDWILCPSKSSQVRSKITQSKHKFYNLLIVLDWLVTCHKIVIVVTN